MDYDNLENYRKTGEMEPITSGVRLYGRTSGGESQHQRRLPEPLPPSINRQRAGPGLDQGRGSGPYNFSGYDGRSGACT